MAKKEQFAAGAQSTWDGKLASLIGTELLMLLVIVLFAGAGVGIAFALGMFEAEVELLMLVVSIAAIALLTLIGACWASIIYLKWYTRHTVVSGQRMQFTANTWNLFWNVIKWLFFFVITIGIYGLWLPIKASKWRFEHTVSYPEQADYGYAQPETNYYYDDNFYYDY